MEQQYLILSLAVLGASVLQSATGIGFGVIAGPIMLMMLNSGAAIQISIALSLLIAAVLAPSLWRHLDRSLLFRLLAGSVVGLPIGLVVFLSIDLGLLKLLAALAVSMTLLFVLRGVRAPTLAGAAPTGRMAQVSMGAVSGIMSGSLAMPGPVPAAWMALHAYGKDTIRATILTMFLFSYLAALGLQSVWVGIGQDTLWRCVYLSPATLAGILIGRWVARLLSEQIFRWVLSAVLSATAGGLFFSSIQTLVQP